MAIEYLSIELVAARLGLSVNTVKGYRAKGLLPAPDAVITTSKSATNGWLPETIDRWNAARPGHGGRPRGGGRERG